MESLLDWDTSLFFYLNGSSSRTWDVVWQVFTNKWTWIPMYVLLAGWAYIRLQTQFWKWLPLLVLMVVLTDQISSGLFKPTFQRLRPCHDPRLEGKVRTVAHECGGKYGFVSSHAANSAGFALFAILTLGIQGWAAGLLWLWVFLTGYSRIYLGVHYPLDVLIGIAVGVGVGWGMSHAYVKWVTRIT